MKVNECRHGIWRRPDMQDAVVLIEVDGVTHAVHRALVSNGYVVLVAGAEVSPPDRSTDTSSDTNNSAKAKKSKRPSLSESEAK